MKVDKGRRRQVAGEDGAAGARVLVERADGYRLEYVRGEKLKAVDALFERHYLGTSGNASSRYAIVSPDGEVVGGAQVGLCSSQHAARDLVGEPYQVRAIRRSWVADECPVPESQLLRAACRHTAERLGETVVMVAYADPAARDSRTGAPLGGFVYLAAGFFYVGETKRPQWAVVDAEGRGRSARQGATTLNPRNILELRPGWRMAPTPPKRIWLAVVTPAGSRAARKRAWLGAWAALNPGRRVAAKRWVSRTEWTRRVRAGQQPIGEADRSGHARPVLLRGNERFQPAWWRGEQVTRTSAPVWLPLWVQETLTWLGEAEVEGERSAGRVYVPRTLAVSV